MNARARTRPARWAPSAITLAVLALAGGAQAQTEGKLETVVVTGSIIKRLSDEKSLPVTTVKATELEARGHMELKDIMLELPQSASLGTNSGSAGYMLNMRGFGPMRTLVLLNGRRLANESYRDQYVNLALLPDMALDRIDVLRDGASSIYGSDAIGGVMNFHTKPVYQGATVKAQAMRPERAGGGDTQRVGLIVGKGDLAVDGWNVYAAFEGIQKSILYKRERPDLIDPSVLNNLGISTTSTNLNSWPANFTLGGTSGTVYNPYYTSGCGAPYTTPNTGTNRNCVQDRDRAYGVFTNGGETYTFFTKGTLNVNEDHKLSVEYSRGESHVIFDRGAPSEANGAVYKVTSASKWYPGGSGGVPVPTLANGSPLAMNGQDIYVRWVIPELGPQKRDDEQVNHRLVLSGEGRIGAWDYRAAVNYGTNIREAKYAGGYASRSGIQAGLLNGTLNPFGMQDAAGAAYLSSITLNGQAYRKATTFNKSADVTLSREVMQLPAGPLMAAVGAELRRDEARNVQPDSNLDVFNDASLGSTNNYSVGRNIYSMFSEVDVPVVERLTLNAALRGDHYTDIKTNTFNPKVALRFEPMPSVVLRGSFNTGFRAPTVVDTKAPFIEFKTVTADDPVLCPGPTPNIGGTGTAVAGQNASVVCNTTINYQTLGQLSDVKPETSRTITWGAAFAPVKNMNLSFDLWRVEIKNMLGSASIIDVLQNPSLYGDLYKRNANGTLNYINLLQGNQGNMRATGVDVSLAYAFPKTAVGNFRASIDGTWLRQWEGQTRRGGDWYSNVGFFGQDLGTNAGLASLPQINYRWKHTAAVAWTLGDWRAQLSQRYSSKYKDQNLRGTDRDRSMAPYSQFNLSTSYLGFKNMRLTFGINNLTNTNPPITNHTSYAGYLTSVADVLGRAYYLTAEYKF